MEDNDRGITPDLIRDILKNVKLILSINDSSNDSILTLYIKAICSNILIKTRRKIFPPELKYIVMDLTIDEFNSNTKLNTDLINSIKSMSEYDRSVTFGANDVIQNKLNLLAKRKIDENESLIKEYRLLYRT